MAAVRMYSDPAEYRVRKSLCSMASWLKVEVNRFPAYLGSLKLLREEATPCPLV